MDVKEKVSVIKRDIITEARNKKDKIISKERNKWEEEYKRFQDKIKTREEELLNRYKSEARLKREEIVSRAVLTKKRGKQERFQKLLKELKQDLLNRLIDFKKDAGYSDFLVKLINEACRLLNTDTIVIGLNTDDRKFYNEVKDKLHHIFPDKKFELNNNEPSIEGGVIVEDIKGNEIIDYSFNTCLEMVEEEMALELKRKVF